MKRRDDGSFGAICVDMGTTNTRVWLVRDCQVVARLQARAGARDTARDGQPARIRRELRRLIAKLRRAGRSAAEPVCVAAAGMIGSPLGLAEVPHLTAPAGIEELAAGARLFSFPDICELPFLFVPGVRSGAVGPEIETLWQSDVMRGEETMCAGLVALGRLHLPATVLNLGSHWKAIRIDASGRVAASTTSLSGEMIHAAQTATILASAVPPGKPEEVDPEWCEAGMREERRAGLARALFCVRLLELGGHATPPQRLSFLIGAFIAVDLDALLARGMITAREPVFITGGGAVAAGWQYALLRASVPSDILSVAETEAGLLAGLHHIVSRKIARGDANIRLPA
jgi:2-dehydro-3-deoxygalactonokinase